MQSNSRCDAGLIDFLVSCKQSNKTYKKAARFLAAAYWFACCFLTTRILLSLHMACCGWCVGCSKDEEMKQLNYLLLGYIYLTRNAAMMNLSQRRIGQESCHGDTKGHNQSICKDAAGMVRSLVCLLVPMRL
jgi:hypothetical protein